MTRRGSYGLRNTNIRRDCANAYLAATVLVDAKRRRGGRIGFGATATASAQARVGWGDKETSARRSYRCSNPCSHERIGFYLFGAMGGPFAWGEIAFGEQPSAPMFRAGNGALSLNSAGLDGRSCSTSARCCAWATDRAAQCVTTNSCLLR